MACVTWCSYGEDIPVKEDPNSVLLKWEIDYSVFTNYGWNQILRIFESEAPTVPGEFWISCHSTASTRTAIGTELSGDGYTRTQVHFERVTDIKRWNTMQVSTPLATAEWTINSFALYDGSTGGNAWAFGNLTETLTITTGKAAVFPNEQLIIGGGAPPT